MSRRLVIAVGAAGLVAASLAVPGPASAHARPSSSVPLTVVASGFAGPLHLAFGEDHELYVADAFAGAIDKVDLRTGTTTTVVSRPGFTPGVDVKGDGRVVYTLSQGGATPDDQGPTWLESVRHGKVRVEADLLAFERAANPDGQVPGNGDAESNPYSVLIWHGATIVADAAGNDLVLVRKGKKPRALVAFPTFTAPGCEQNNAPLGVECDPVPTDVELGPDGYLYVSGLGAEVEGHIYKVNPWSGAIVRTWGGLPPLTGIAVGRDGTIYAASLFTDQVFRFRGSSTAVATVPGPTDVELGHGMLVAASQDGNVYRISAAAFSSPTG